VAKWADFLISAVRYNAKHTHIEKVKVHEDLGDSVGNVGEFTRPSIVGNIKNGSSYVTIFKTADGKWSKGQDVRIARARERGYVLLITVVLSLVVRVGLDSLNQCYRSYIIDSSPSVTFSRSRVPFSGRQKTSGEIPQFEDRREFMRNHPTSFELLVSAIAQASLLPFDIQLLFSYAGLWHKSQSNMIMYLLCFSLCFCRLLRVSPF